VTAPVNVNAHLPFVPLEGRYRLGAALEAGVDDFWFNTTHDDGTHIVADEPSGWEGLEFITPIDTAGGRDGGLLGPQSVGPRVLPVRGVMVAPTALILRQKIRQLRAKLGPRKLVVWDQHDFGEQLRMGMVCRATGDFAATPVQGNQRGGVAAPFQFTLVAANPPWKYGTGEPKSDCIGLPIAEVSGRTYDKSFDYDYGDTANPGGVMYVTNKGDIDAWPVVQVTGPVDFPILFNETTGGTYMISGYIPENETVTVDSRTGIVTPSGYRLVGRPFPLAPGQNTLRWRATSGSYTPDAQFCVTWRPTWE
jgi:hypothetical protein